MIKLHTRFAALFAVASLAFAADASAVSFSFSGVITEISVFDLHYNPGIAIGDAFNGTLRYRTDLLDSDPDPEIGFYDLQFSDVTIHLTINGMDWETEPILMQPMRIANRDSGDSLELAGENAGEHVLYLGLFDSTATALGADSIPETLEIGEWTDGLCSLTYLVGTRFDGRITAGASRIPDGTQTAVLLGLSLTAVLALDRFRARG